MGGRASGRRRDRVRASAPRVPIVVLIAAFVLQAWGAPALGQVDAASEASAPPVSVPTRAPASTAPAAASVDAAPRPDIVVIYMDDFSPVGNTPST